MSKRMSDEEFDAEADKATNGEEYSPLLAEAHRARESEAELLEALEDIISEAFRGCQPDRGDLFSRLDDIARAAIAKAEGRE